MREFLAMTNALSDPNRVRLLVALRGREVCVCNLVELIGLADSTVSKHMSILKLAGLVESRKCGRWVYYRLAGDDGSPLVKSVMDLIDKHLAGDRVIALDADRVTELILRHDGNRCQPDEVAGAKREPAEVVGAS